MRWPFLSSADQQRNVAHDLLKGLRHVVEGTVSEYNGEFEQAVRIDIGQQAGHFLDLALKWTLQE